MDNLILIAIISSSSALTGALIGSIPSMLQFRVRKQELKEKKISRIHSQTIELLKVNLERVKLLEINKGVYSTYQPPMYLYWKFYNALNDIEDQKELSKDSEEMIKKELEQLGQNPADWGFSEK